MKTITKQEALPKIPRRKRVAAYARVSRDSDAMKHSLSAQVSYYNELIQNRMDWEFAGVYPDYAETGTKDQRPEFQRMLADCRAGKIDMVITKSVTRFARNTVTTLEAVRELKLLGMDVFFEKENIHSMSGDGELMLSILASYAQEESRSASENVKWRLRSKFKEGRPSSTVIMGYKLVDGTFIIVPEEAEVVRMIFDDFLSGMGRNAIMKKLTELDVPNKRGGSWTETTIYTMLRNEKYVGDLCLQKWFSENHISKKKRMNKGELPQYYVENSHEPIIDRDTFIKVQAELDRRAALHSLPPRKSEPYQFTGKIVCGQCGKNYRRKINGTGKKAVWVCGTFNQRGKAACDSRQIPESVLLEIADTDFTKILISEPGVLIIVRPDGTEIEKQWQHKSRRESWTPAMRQAAKERQLKLNQERRAKSDGQQQ
ncbi:hypothetical protein FACS1894132_02170 [Clostridia bacterium]|nr:hypothetical protein FACS1894132_02170 [Clostridia bacterium]